MNQRFANMRELRQAITDKVPVGGRNCKLFDAKIARHMTVERAKDVDPSEKSERAVVITAIFAEPLPAVEHRGRKGQYAERLKVLLLSEKSFKGTMWQLENQLGIYQKVLPELAQSFEKKTGSPTGNIWNQFKEEIIANDDGDDVKKAVNRYCYLA